MCFQGLIRTIRHCETLPIKTSLIVNKTAANLFINKADSDKDGKIDV